MGPEKEKNDSGLIANLYLLSRADRDAHHHIIRRNAPLKRIFISVALYYFTTYSPYPDHRFLWNTGDPGDHRPAGDHAAPLSKGKPQGLYTSQGENEISA